MSGGEWEAEKGESKHSGCLSILFPTLQETETGKQSSSLSLIIYTLVAIESVSIRTHALTIRNEIGD